MLFFKEQLLDWKFEVYNIRGWSIDDHGERFYDEEGGCSAITDWIWADPNNEDARADFNLPFFIKSGCVECAIASAGGPKISSQPQGFQRALAKQAVAVGNKNRVGLIDSTHTYIPMDWSKEGYRA